MGTYRTNKIHVKEAWKIDNFNWDAKTGFWEINLIPTPFTQFEAPLYSDYIWSLGELHTEASSGELINNKKFKNKKLYKVVNREGDAYLLILQLFPDSKVYEGASSGTGLYFETDILQALGYISYRNSGRIYEDQILIKENELNIEKSKSNV